MIERFLLWYEGAAPPARWSVWLACGILVFGLGSVTVVGAIEERAERLTERADRLEERLERERQLVEAYEPLAPETEDRLEAMKATLRTAEDTLPVGLESSLLAVLSRMAEEAGGTAALFNLRGRTEAPGPLTGFRLLTFEGEFLGSTLAVTRFLEATRRAPVPLWTDSVALVRQVPRNSAYFRFRALAPATATRTSGSGPESDAEGRRGAASSRGEGGVGDADE